MTYKRGADGAARSKKLSSVTLEVDRGCAEKELTGVWNLVRSQRKLTDECFVAKPPISRLLHLRRPPVRAAGGTPLLANCVNEYPHFAKCGELAGVSRSYHSLRSFMELADITH